MISRRRHTRNLTTIELNRSTPYEYTKHYAKVIYTDGGSYTAGKYAGRILPFDYTPDEKTEIYQITNVTGAGSKMLLHINEYPNMYVPANTPFIFKSSTSFSSSNPQIIQTGKVEMKPPTDQPLLQFDDDTHHDIYGIFSPFTPPTSNAYYAMDTRGALSAISTSSTVQCYRWYIHNYS